MDVQLPGVLTVREAADLLGVTTQQVGYLGRSGDVTFVARGLLDAASVRALRVARQGRHTRALAPHTAWAAIAMLSGHQPSWLGQPQVSRLRSRLLRSDTTDLVADTRTRAKVYRYTGHRSAAGRISEDPGTIRRRPLPDLVDHRLATDTDWYVETAQLNDLTKRFGLKPSESGTFVLRAFQNHYRHGTTIGTISTSYTHTSSHTSDAQNWTSQDRDSYYTPVHDHDSHQGAVHNQARNRDSASHRDGPSGRDGVDHKLVAAVMLDSNVLTALDSSTSDDPRERGVAERVLDHALTAFYRREAGNG